MYILKKRATEEQKGLKEPGGSRRGYGSKCQQNITCAPSYANFRFKNLSEDILVWFRGEERRRGRKERGYGQGKMIHMCENVTI